MSEKRVDALKQALQMEKDGRAFYQQALEQSNHPMARKIFDFLIRAEDEHIKKITYLYNRLQQEGTWPDAVITRDNPGRMENIFAAALKDSDPEIKGDENDIEALKAAAAFEDKGQKYYQSLAEGTEDPFEKKFYFLLFREEGEHFVSLLDTIEYLEDPQGYFHQLERGTISF